jgi:hypothetical protein
MPNCVEKILSSQQIGMRLYTKLVMIMELEQQTLPHPKIYFSRVYNLYNDLSGEWTDTWRLQ